jgi:uncharacterized membrane protein YgdD (TMEM256/DUF423 family)
MTARILLVAGALLAALGVGLGAFGAHWLEARLEQWYPLPEDSSRMRDVWEVAVRYQMYHAFGILVTGLLALWRSTRGLLTAGGLFVMGTAIFSGCLYALVLTGVRLLGAVVPLGGVLLITGWIVLACTIRSPAATVPERPLSGGDCP